MAKFVYQSNNNKQDTSIFKQIEMNLKFDLFTLTIANKLTLFSCTLSQKLKEQRKLETFQSNYNRFSDKISSKIATRL